MHDALHNDANLESQFTTITAESNHRATLEELSGDEGEAAKGDAEATATSEVKSETAAVAEQEKATTAADSTTPVRADDNAAEGEATTTTAGTYEINRIESGLKNIAPFASYRVTAPGLG